MRDFHATPDLCPSTAASTDIARRCLLTAVAAAPVIAVSGVALAERYSDNADADYLAAFAAKLADREQGAEDDTPEEAAASWRRHDYLADTPVVTLPGAVAKLAFAADEACDYAQINDPDSPLPRALASLRASLPGLPQSVAAALAFAAEAIESNTRDHNMAFGELYRSAGDAAKWLEQERIFERTGANKMLESRRQQNPTGPVNERGYTEDEEDLAATFKALNDDGRRDMLDFAALMLLTDKSCFAFEHLGGDWLKNDPHKAAAMRLIARSFAAAADRIDPPAEAA